MKKVTLTAFAALMAAMVLGLAAGAQPAPQGVVVLPPTPQIQASISVDKPVYQPGERIRIFYTVSAPAFVYVIDIDAQGRLTQIFPNVFAQNNFVSAGQHTLPEGNAYSLVVTPPTGTEIVQIIASSQPLDLGAQGFGQGFPSLGSNPSQFQGQAQAAVQGIIAAGGDVASAFTTFQVGGAPSNNAPVASFTASPSSPNVGQAVLFDASSSFDSDGFITSYEWDFNGDGFADASGSRVTQTFFVAGQATIRLTVRDNGGLSSTTSQLIQVGRLVRPPVASFSFSPSAPQVNQAVLFDAGSSFDADGFITNYQWDFNGDGFNDASGVRVNVTFQSAGQRRVTLTVRDNSGLTATATQFVNVGQSQPSFNVPGFYVDSPSPNLLRIRVQGQGNWFSLHAFRMILETDGVFSSVNQQGTGSAAPQGITPVPNQDILDVSGFVGNGSFTYLIGISSNASKVKFDLQLDLDGDGDLERQTNFVFLGTSLVNPPSNPFVLSFSAGNFIFDVSLKVCLVLVDQPGIHFSICFRFNS